MSCSEIIRPLSAFNHVFTVNINGVKTPIDVDLLLLTNHLKRVYDKFTGITGNIPTEIKNELNQIILETSNTTRQIIYVIAGGILILLILLVLLIFMAIYYQNDYIIPAAFVLALFFIIVITLIIYLWIISIYNTSSRKMKLHITNVNHYLLTINSAILPSLSCLSI